MIVTVIMMNVKILHVEQDWGVRFHIKNGEFDADEYGLPKVPDRLIYNEVIIKIIIIMHQIMA